MAITLSSALEKALKKGSARPVVLAEVQVNVPTGTSTTEAQYYNIRFCSGDRPLRNVTRDTAEVYRAQYIIPNLITQIDNLAQEVDLVERSTSIGSMSLTLVDDGTIRDIMKEPGTGLAAGSGGGSRHLLGQQITLSFGVQDIDVDDFVSMGIFLIEEVLPNKGFIELQIRSISSLLASLQVKRNFRARDPHAQMHQILRHTAALTDTFYDESSIDPNWTTTPANDIDRRHLATRRATEMIDDDFLTSDKGPNGEDAWSLLQELTYITGGFVYENNEGKIEYVPYVADKAATRTLDDDDITDYSQEVTYGNTINKVTHTITTDQVKVSYNPYEGNAATPSQGNWAGPSQQAAYFGGTNSDSSLTLVDETSAREFSPEASSAVPNTAYSRKRFFELQNTISFVSGTSFCPFLMARTVAWQSQDSALTGTLGLASYVHSTRKVTLASGKLNITDISRSDYVAITKGMVLRVVDDSASANAEGVVFKEGRIIHVDNGGSASVITLADDQVLEFTADFGQTNAVGWEIIDPEAPTDSGVQLLATQGGWPGPNAGSMGLRKRFAGGGNAGVARKYDCQRYFYIQYAAHTGFTGAHYGRAADPSSGFSLAGVSPRFQTGIAGSEVASGVAPGVGDAHELAIAYGHTSAGTEYAQLRGAEYQTNKGASEDARYAFIKLESNAQVYSGSDAVGYIPGIAEEIIRCNLAYPTTAYAISAQVGAPGSVRYLHRPSFTAAEGVYQYSGTRDPTVRLLSCATYRVEAESVTTLPVVTLGYAGGAITYGGGIKPSGRAALGSELPGAEGGGAANSYSLALAGSFYKPQAISAPVPADASTGVEPPELFWLGVKATDMTPAYFINKRIIDRCSEGVPTVNISTSLRHIDLELGDFVALSNDVYLRKDKNGSDTGTIFEIIRKEVLLDSDSPSINFQLAWVRQDATPPSVTVTVSVEPGKTLTLGSTITMASPRMVTLTNDGTPVIDRGGNPVYGGSGIPGS